MIDKTRIISTLSNATKSRDHIHAMWLEGSGPQGFADEYSDIDVWFSVDDDRIFSVYEELEAILETIAKIDFKYVVKREGELGQSMYHLEGAGEFLMVDINTQGRGRNVSLLSGIDDAEIIFDKANIVKMVDRIPPHIDLEAKRQKLRGFYDQMRPNVLKGIRRGRKLEAIYYYHLILRYATKFLWLKSDMPEKKDFDLKHLHRSVSAQDIQALERFYDVPASGIENALAPLKDWLYSL